MLQSVNAQFFKVTFFILTDVELPTTENPELSTLQEVDALSILYPWQSKITSLTTTPKAVPFV